MRRPLRLVAGLFLVCLGWGCGGGAPRKWEPPTRRDPIRRDMIEIRGMEDLWHEGLVLIREVEAMGGVEEMSRDETTGKFVIVYNPQRTTRDRIHAKIVRVGRETGQEYDPLFDSR